MSGKSQSVNYWEIVGKIFTSVILGTILAVLLILIIGSALYVYFWNELPPDQNAQGTLQAVDALYTGCFVLPLQIIFLILFSFLVLYLNQFTKMSVGKVLAIAGLAEFLVTFLLTWSWLRWLASSFGESVFTRVEYIVYITLYLSISLALFFVLLVIPYWQTPRYDT